MDLFLGVDFGTSGCRACVIDAAGRVVSEHRESLPAPKRDGRRSCQPPSLWWKALEHLLDVCLADCERHCIRAITVDGTSPTLLLCDKHGEPLGEALMYDDTRAFEQAARLRELAPAGAAVHGAGSGLSKLLWLLEQPWGKALPRHALFQSDWLANRLSHRFGISDANNALKLGYDPVSRCWPDWLGAFPRVMQILPAVIAPGESLGLVHPPLAARFGLSASTRIIAGTTDGTAAFIATGASQTGDAVTSLGTTLVMKVLADEPVFAPEYGIYSQPLGDRWLLGGGSNSGGGVLREYFSDADLHRLSAMIEPDKPSGLNYYPLSRPGERFPLNDPDFPPRLVPRPADDALFLQGLFEGMAQIEHLAYQRLENLGAPYPGRVLSVGGGAANPVWTRIRQGYLGIPVQHADHDQAAYGAALLALGG